MEPTPDDLRELKRLLALGSTPYIEALFKAEIAKLEAKFPEQPPKAEPATPAPVQRRYTSIDSYLFSDGSDKAEVIIREIRGLEQAQIEFEPKDHAFQISIIREAQNMPNLRLTISPLFKKILPGESTYKVRRETLTIVLKKKKSMSWSKLKKTMDLKPSKKSSNEEKKVKEDPNTALMDMMKKMYDEGDDEMKRTISKAMWEAQHKKPGSD